MFLSIWVPNCLSSYGLCSSWLIMVYQTPKPYPPLALSLLLLAIQLFVLLHLVILVLERNLCMSLKVWQHMAFWFRSERMIIMNLHLSLVWICLFSTSLWVCNVWICWCMRWHVSNFVLLQNFSGAEFLLQWSCSFPKTNVLWLQYLVDILLLKKSYVSLLAKSLKVVSFT